MKNFRCDHCRQLVFFENVRCVSCDHSLAFLPDLGVIGSLDPQPGKLYTSPLPLTQGRSYRLCENSTRYNVCNWAVLASDPQALCVACRLNRVIPDLSVPGNQEAWYRIEVAKRRLVYSLLALRLSIPSTADDPIHGLAFEFLADTSDLRTPRVMTGHEAGTITLNIAEADDAIREQVRRELKEPYRTLLGHFRHESGHYYWNRLIQNTPRLHAFRELFGDETADYNTALMRYHEMGPPGDWAARFVSAYAGAHPWEDWAETWAHYLHITDTLETAAVSGVRMRPPRAGDPALRTIVNPIHDEPVSFDEVLESWLPLTYLLNNLNRGLGLPDAYPFVLTASATRKLAYVHETIQSHRLG